MSLTAGIVGLPNVGKSTLFNAITKAGALAANYPFATIEPNVGIVEVPDHRLTVLSKMSSSKKIIAASCEFTDIAGLVKGASQGEGLGNQFLSNIRNCDAILHVVRCFDDGNITHVEGNVDPIRDVEIINLELILADLDIVEKRIPKIEKKAHAKIDDAAMEYAILKRIYEALILGKPIRSLEFDEVDSKYVKNYGFLTSKDVMYVANIAEEFVTSPTLCKHYISLLDYANKENSKIIPFSAEIESQLATLTDEDRDMFLADLGIIEPGLDTLVKATYNLLGLATYLTTGVQETRAWTFKKGMTAPQCAGVIHTDFERGFIRAETVAYDDLVECKSMLAAKEKGKVRQEGKEYIVKDGDVMLFKFNV